MAIKILHAADFHMDSPFNGLPEQKARIRRKEQRKLFEKLVSICEAESIQLLLLPGDLFDSNLAYQETVETVSDVFSKIRAEIFIAPGNHDYLCLKSPYNKISLPENVHIFSSPSIKCVELPELNCRVWGAGFNSSQSTGLLNGFNTGYSTMTDIMVLHGDTFGGPYNPITTIEIADSGLDYLALGHVHSFDGFHRAGKTVYAYSGCPEGRGFDETGQKGYIIGTIDKNNVNLDFRPMGGREYRIHNIDLTGKTDILEMLNTIKPPVYGSDICRIILTGEYDPSIDTQALEDTLADKFFHTELKIDIHPTRDIWAEAEDDTLKGLFIRRLHNQYDAADDTGKKQIMKALRFGIGALENREEWC